MQLTAKLHKLLPIQTGMGKNGQWKKQEFILDIDGQYPKKLCISVWGDKINEKILVPGNMITVDFDLESREYNGRWYTEVKAWKVEKAGDSQPDNSENGFAPTNLPPFESNEGDDLPF